MSGTVNRRRYDTRRRRERAQQARLRVVAAAREMFVQRGYATTTIKDIAAAAGVSAELIYTAFGSKPALLKAVFEITMAGDDDPVPMMDRPELLAVRAEPHPERALRLYARFVAHTASRALPVHLVVLTAAASDAAVAAMAAELEAQRLHGMSMFAAGLARTGRLAVPEAEARDMLWALNSAQLHDLLVTRRGWAPQRYEQFLGDTWVHGLLTPT